jgi:hypothetical protein
LIPVETVTTDYCKAHDQLNVSATSTSGYIASVVTSDTPYCDGSSHPWVISGLPGQTINLTLYDFAVDTGNMLVVSGGSGSRPQYSTGGGTGARRHGQHQQQVYTLSSPEELYIEALTLHVIITLGSVSLIG